MGRRWTFIASAAAIVLAAMLFWLAYPRTRYAPGYSSAAFRHIQLGTTTNEIRKLLGEPLYEVPLRLVDDGATMLIYSDDEEGGLFDLGWYGHGLVVSNGIVVEKSSDFIYHPLWRVQRNWPFGADTEKH